MIKDTLALYLFFFTLSILLAIIPSLDIAASNLFYYGNGQFLVKHYLVGKEYFYEFLIRRIGIPFVVLFLLFFPILLIFFPVLQKNFKTFLIKKTDIGFIWLSAILLSFFINSILKETWGRARPNDILEFGGEKFFSSWVQISSECLGNCSFVSGDSSVGFFIASFYYITKEKKFLYFSLVAGLVFGFIRIGAGAHFLSDILMSFVIVNLSLNIIHIVYYNLLKWIKA